MKYLESINFDPVKINTFDIETCEGMKQVAMINEEARHMQINKTVCKPSDWFKNNPLNCWKTLKTYILQHKDEICLSANV